jgi:hypothetical protein
MVNSMRCVCPQQSTSKDGSPDETVETSWLNQLAAQKHHQDEMQAQVMESLKPATK